MVAKCAHHSDIAIYVLREIVYPVRERFVFKAHPVTLNVRLRPDVDPGLVAQRVPVGIVRIMTRAHCVCVDRLESRDIPLHLVKRNGVSAGCGHLMAVNAFDKYAAIVYLQHAVFYLDPPEADRKCEVILRCLHFERVEIRRVAVPENRIVDAQLPVDYIPFCLAVRRD